MEHISQADAARRLGVTRPTLNYYMKILNIQAVKFDFNKQKYLKMGDFEAIQDKRRKALELRGEEARDEILV